MAKRSARASKTSSLNPVVQLDKTESASSLGTLADWLTSIPAEAPIGPRWTLPKEWARFKAPHEADLANHPEAGWAKRWLPHGELWDSFAGFPQLAASVIKQRKDDLIKNKFKKISNPQNAPQELVVLEKVHSKMLREQHWFSIPGVHARSLEILDGKRLLALVNEIKAATNKALAGDKLIDTVRSVYFKGHHSNTPKGVSWRLAQDEDELRQGLDPDKLTSNQKANLKNGFANKKYLVAFMDKHWDLMHALRVYDPLSPTDSAFAIEPFRGAPAVIQKTCLAFIGAIIRTEEIWERSGAPKETRSLNKNEQMIAENLRRSWKGTEKGSVRFIAEEIRMIRGVSRKCESSLQRAIKRHFQRKGI